MDPSGAGGARVAGASGGSSAERHVTCRDSRCCRRRGGGGGRGGRGHVGGGPLPAENPQQSGIRQPQCQLAADVHKHKDSHAGVALHSTSTFSMAEMQAEDRGHTASAFCSIYFFSFLSLVIINTTRSTRGSAFSMTLDIPPHDCLLFLESCP